VQFWKYRTTGAKVRPVFRVAWVACLPLCRLITTIVRVRHDLVVVPLMPRALVVTKTPQEAPPVLGRGALCGDSMGLV
jgi:hypothetical protein